MDTYITKTKLLAVLILSPVLLFSPVAAEAQYSAVGATAQAQSITELQAQIQALLAQVQQLQARLAAMQAGTSVSAFTRNLSLGSTGVEVRALQQFLNTHGAPLAASGPGSPGNETTTFGPLTQAALARWQAANGISPTLGYFGPLTRNRVNSILTPAVGGAPGEGTTPPPSAGISVSLAAANPPAGALISSADAAAARVPVLAVNVTAGASSAATISRMRFHKNGVISDNAISGAYIIDRGKVVGRYTSISQGVIDFSGLQIDIPAGRTVELTLAIDPSSGLAAGNTAGFSLNSASDITASVAGAPVTASGSFPLNGNLFTVTSVSNPSLASVAVASSSVSTRITAGTTNNLVGSWNFTVSNSRVFLRGINFTVIGSANKADIRNVKLIINGTQAGAPLPSVASDGSAFFDLSSGPPSLNTGSNSVQVFADILGSPSFSFQFELLNSYDVFAVDSQYNVPVLAQSNTGTQVAIQQGSVTTTLSSNTPTGNIAKGQSGVTLARFTIFASSEPVRIRFLGFNINFSGVSAGSTAAQQVRNVSLIDDAGQQVGNTIGTPPSSASCDAARTGVTGPSFSASTGVYADCFGTSSSPINYTIPANTSRVLSLRADIQSTASFSTAAALFTGNTENLQGLISFQTGSTGPITGSALTLATSQLTVTQNTGVGSQTVAGGASNARIGSYSFTASSAEGVTINNISVRMGSSGASFSNLRLMTNGQQIGSTQATLSNNGTFAFSGQFSVPAGSTRIIDVFADALSSAATGTLPIVTTLAGCSGNGSVSLASVTCPSVSGQSVVVAGQSSVQAAVDSSSPPANQVAMGSTGSILASFLFVETAGIEDVKITDLNVFDRVASTATVLPAFFNLTISGGGSSATAGSAQTSADTTVAGPGYLYSFHFANPVIVPRSGSVSLVLRGDVSSFSAAGATDNTAHTFKIATSTDPTNSSASQTVVAFGATSNRTVALTLPAATANPVTVLRTKLTVTATPLGIPAGRTKSAVDDLATITFAADNAGALLLNTVRITFSGSAPNGTNFFSTSAPVTLYDPANGTTFSPTATNGASTMTYNLNNFVVSAGSSKSFILRIDSTPPVTVSGQSGISQSLSATISSASDVSYTTAIAGGTSGVNLPTYVTPVQITSISYAQGT